MEQTEREILLDIQQRITAMEKREARRRRWRIFRGVLTAVLLVLLAMAAYRGYNVVLAEYNDLAAQLEEVQKAVDELDVDALVKTVNDLSSMDTKGLKNALSYFAAMNVEELETTLNSLRDAVGNVAQLDMTALNEGIENVNNTLEPIMKFFGIKKA